MVSYETQIWIFVAILLLILALLVGLTFTAWYNNMTNEGRTIYWVIGGVVLIIIIIILLLLVFRKPVVSYPPATFRYST